MFQNNIVARLCFNLANANGLEDGGTNRETIAKEMTAAAIAKAQAIARECISIGYRKCGY